MIEITTVLPRQYLEGKRLIDGRVMFEDGELDKHTLSMYQKNPKFTVREIDTKEGNPSPDSLSIEEAIQQAIIILQPACKDYGIPLADIEAAFWATFEKARKDKGVDGLETEEDDKPWQAVLSACVELEAEAPRDEEKFAGSKPKTQVLTDMVGFRVSGQLRDAAWAAAHGDE